MWRFMRVMWYYMTGRFSHAAKVWSGNEYVMEATYDTSIEKKLGRISQVKDAVAALIGRDEEKMAKVKQLTDSFTTMEKVKAGAVGKAKQLANELSAQGVSSEDIKKNVEYMKHMTAYQDASTNAAEYEARIKELEQDIEAGKNGINQYKVQLQQMQRDLEKLREEKHDALAEVAIAKESEQVNNLLAGIATDTTDKDLANVRDAVKLAKSKAKITSELAGNDAALAEAEYVSFASKHDASNEFDALIGLSETAAVELEPAQIPEK